MTQLNHNDTITSNLCFYQLKLEFEVKEKNIAKLKFSR